MQGRGLDDSCSIDRTTTTRERGNVLSMEEIRIPGGPMLFYDEIRLSIMKSLRSPNLEDSLLFIYFSKCYIKP